MKIVFDFDGVLTDLATEAARFHAVFTDAVHAAGRACRVDTLPLITEAVRSMDEAPHHHGWRVNGRITAFCNEDLFVRVNALASCLDGFSDSAASPAAAVRRALGGGGNTSFTALATECFHLMAAETAAGLHNPVEAATAGVLNALVQRGVQVVVVSNSSTARILQLLAGIGIAATEHAPGVAAPIRVRGHAGKFALGTTPRTVSIGHYAVELDRPGYRAILDDELPDVVVGDVFSLDLALPMAWAAETGRTFTAVLRERSYTPAWSAAHLRAHTTGPVRAMLVRTLDPLVSLSG